MSTETEDALHKYSRAAVNDAGAVFVGNVSSSRQTQVDNGKAVLDVSWASLRNMLRYKCDHAGVLFAEVDEKLYDPDLYGLPERQRSQGPRRSGIRQWGVQRMRLGS